MNQTMTADSAPPLEAGPLGQGRSAADLASGKGHKDENFPVASWLVRPDARAPVLAYYHFARRSDDIADNPEASAEEKLDLLSAMRAGLASGGTGAGGGASEARALAAAARERGISLVHAHELLDAFEQDVSVSRYADWQGLIDYCRLSAVPVGRFVLDVHGEDPAIWPLNDALCAALQVINHLQDCGKDYRAMDRVYIPTRMLEKAGVPVEALGEARSSAALRGVIVALAGQTRELLRQSAPFAAAIADLRLSAEVAIIQRLAEDLVELLARRDPLSENVHHSKPRAAALALGALIRHGWQRIFA
jgi:squalene synthase HpnC